MTDEALLTVEDVAALLKMSTRYVYDAARLGRIPHLKMGRVYRFRRADIRAWLDDQAKAS